MLAASRRPVRANDRCAASVVNRAGPLQSGEAERTAHNREDDAHNAEVSHGSSPRVVAHRLNSCATYAHGRTGNARGNAAACYKRGVRVACSCAVLRAFSNTIDRNGTRPTRSRVIRNLSRVPGHQPSVPKKVGFLGQTASGRQSPSQWTGLPPGAERQRLSRVVVQHFLPCAISRGR